MQTQCNVEQLEFSCVGRRRVVAAFDGGQVTSELCRSSPSSGPRRCGDLTCGLAKRFLKIVGPVITGPIVTASDPSTLNCQLLFGPGRR
jgi:hypothetical protein